MPFNPQHCLNFITKEINFEIVAKTVREVDADVVRLNEIRGKGSNPEYAEQVEQLAKLTGMSYFHFAQVGDTEKVKDPQI